MKKNYIILLKSFSRVHDNVLKGNMVFLVLREDFFTIQAVAFKHKDNATISKQFIKYLGKVPKESIVEIEAKVVKPPEEIKSTTQKVYKTNYLPKIINICNLLTIGRTGNNFCAYDFTLVRGVALPVDRCLTPR